jgi:hypothetical protein
MNTVLKSEMFLLLVAAALFALVVLQYNGTLDVVHEVQARL